MNPILVESAPVDAPPVVVVRVEVDLDLATCEDVAAQLVALTAAPGYDRVVIDVLDQFVSARGLAVLARSVLAACARNRAWAVAGVSRVVLRRLAREWYPEAPMYRTVDEAVRAVARAGTGGSPGVRDLPGGNTGRVGEQDGTEIEAQFATALAAATRILGVDDVGVTLLDEHDALRVLGSSGGAGALLEEAQLRLGAGPGIDAVAARRTVAVPDLLAAPGYAELWEDVRDGVAAPARAVLAVPLRIDGEIVGNLNAMRVQPHPWTEREIAATEAYADTVALLLRQGAVQDRRSRTTGPDEH